MWIPRRWPHVGLLLLTASALWLAPAVSTAQSTPVTEEPAAPADEETPSTGLDAQEPPPTDGEDLSTELVAPQRIFTPPPPDPGPKPRPTSGWWWRPAAAVFGATSAMGALCGGGGMLAAAVVSLPLAATCCGVGAGASVLGVWCYAACLCAVPAQAVTSVVLALAMPFAAMLGAWVTGLQNTVPMGLLKVWGLSAAASITALVLGLLGVALLVGVGLTAGFAGVLAGGVGSPVALYSMWLVFAGALAVASVLPVTLAVVAQAVPALFTMALVVWEQSP